jgi:hypothetical protein
MEDKKIVQILLEKISADKELQSKMAAAADVTAFRTLLDENGVRPLPDEHVEKLYEAYGY